MRVRVNQMGRSSGAMTENVSPRVRVRVRVGVRVRVRVRG